jgi:hypothetical protein
MINPPDQLRMATAVPSVQLCFGLLASNKQPIVCPIESVEAKVLHIAKHGTYADASLQTLVYDSYEVLASCEKLRAFADIDIKRYVDKTPVPPVEGVVLKFHLETVLESIVPALTEDYGRVVVGNSCGSKADGEYCVSFRLWFPCLVGCRVALTIFAADLAAQLVPAYRSVLGESLAAKISWDDFLDTSVYRGVTKLRLPGCTKQGEKKRPLLIDPVLSSDGWKYSDTLVTFWNVNHVVTLPTPCVDGTDIPATEPVAPTDDPVTPLNSSGALSDSVFNLVTDLANLIQHQWDKNAQRFQFMAALWSLEPSARMRAFIHAQCAAKNPNNNPVAIDGQISRIHFSGVSPRSILKFAWEANREEVKRLKKLAGDDWKVLVPTSNLLDLSASDMTLIDEITRIGTASGTWKMEEYSEPYVKPYPVDVYDTIVVKSPMGTGKTVQLFDIIRRYKRVLILSARRSYSAFIHSELLTHDLGFYNYMDCVGHLAGRDRLILQVESLHRIDWEYTPYDLVIMDESESLLFQMNSVGTHGEHHKLNYEMLSRVVRDAIKVIAMDAFVTARTFIFLDYFRERNFAIYIHNTFQPYDRRAFEMCVVQGKRVLPDFAGLTNCLLNFARNGKRIVFVCSSKMKGVALYERLLKEGFKTIFHSGDDGVEQKNALLNVREEWAKYQIVIYTTTITVGVSYSNVPAEAEFDELFLYATASCALPRDIAQALLRARKIKSNQLWFCIEERCAKTQCVGLGDIVEGLSHRKDIVSSCGAIWEQTPPWVLHLIARNEHEIGVSRNLFAQTLKRYLRDSGNTIMPPREADELLAVDCESISKPLYDDIVDLGAFEAEYIDEKVMQGRATKEEKLQLLKWKFVRKFTAEGAETAPAVWNTLFAVPEGSKRSRESLFWNIVHEKQRLLGEAWKAEAASRYVEQAKSSLVKQTAIKELCEILGLAHSCEEKTWSHEVFEALAPKVLAVEEKMRKAMGLRARQGKRKESELMQACTLVNQAFEAWSGTTVVKNGYKKRERGILFRKYTVSTTTIVHEMWSCLKS